ncbi:MAG: zf-HC2 domain-containing protein [Acidobacteriota bacterium]|nr:zf-HC2 domain-containing protein [Acidobacteriota bacterium]
MAQTLNNEEMMVRYLLGELSEEEQSRLEDEYFARDDFFEQLLVIEDDLIDAYVRGELSANRRAQFEKHFLSLPQRRERVGFASELLRPVAQTSASTHPATVNERTLSWWQSMFPLPRFSLAVAAVLLVAVALASIWFAFDRNERRARLAREEAEHGARRQPNQTASPPQQTAKQDGLTNEESALERAASPQPQTKDEVPARVSRPTNNSLMPPAQSPRASAAIASLTLSPDLVRSTGEANRFVLTRGTDMVRLRLALNGDERHKNYRASLQTVDGKDIWSRRARAAQSSRSGAKAVTLQLPAHLLPTGDYILTLSGVTADGSTETVAEYYLKVEKE